MLLKMMTGEDDTDTRSTFQLIDSVTSVKFYREGGGAKVEVYSDAGGLETYDLEGNAYILNANGVTIASFGCAPIPTAEELEAAMKREALEEEQARYTRAGIPGGPLSGERESAAEAAARFATMERESNTKFAEEHGSAHDAGIPSDFKETPERALPEGITQQDLDEATALPPLGDSRREGPEWPDRTRSPERVYEDRPSGREEDDSANDEGA